MRRARVVQGGLALGLLAMPARADPALELSMSECSVLSEAALREHLSLELRTLGLSSARVQLRVRCANEVVELTAGREARPEARTRVALQDTARAARERLIALAASELLAQVERARRAEADRERADRERADSLLRSPPRRAPEPRPAPRAARRESHRELSAAAAAVSQGAPRSTLWGAAVGARLGFGPRWSLMLDGRFERGSEALSLADVTATSWSGLVAAATHLRRGPLELSAALGVRAGWLAWGADARGTDEGRNLTAPWAGVALPLRVAWGAALVRPFAGVEAGYVTLPVRGNVSDGQALLEHRGAWLSASLGVAVAL